jgi:tetratricopeptide (TPR) repeat protein
LEESLRRNPTYANAHYELGNVYVKLGKRQDAIRKYEKTVALDSDMSEADYSTER